MRAAFVAAARANWGGGSVYIWAITDGAPDLLGTIALHLGERAAVGYWVAPWARTAASRHARSRRSAPGRSATAASAELELTTHPENAASQRVAEKAGFSREGLVPDYVQTPSRPARFRRLLSQPLSHTWTRFLQ